MAERTSTGRAAVKAALFSAPEGLGLEGRTALRDNESRVSAPLTLPRAVAASRANHAAEGEPVFKLPKEHRRRMRTSNPIERSIQQELKRRTQKIRVFPNEASLERLATAVPVEIDETWTASLQPYVNWNNVDAD